MSERRRTWGEDAPSPPHVWVTLGYRHVDAGEGFVAIEWDATEQYAFSSPSGPIIHGGLVTTILDTAMGGACWSVLGDGESFLTADLRVEFFGPARPGTLRARGEVVRRTRRTAFCAAELVDSDGETLAASRCTQLVRNDG